MSDVLVRTVPMMGTVVTFQVVGQQLTEGDRREREAAMDRAAGWFRSIEACCTRFDERSELRQLSSRIGTPVPASEMLFEAVRFALAVAAETNGAFDPTVGQAMESRGFNREHRTGAVTTSVSSTVVESPDRADPGAPSFRDVHTDAAARTITLDRPLTLDLGAVAKGLAIDMAARELMPFHDFAVDAGGDLYLGGRNADGESWRVGVRHPRREGETVDVLRVSGAAVCTSGDYERAGVATDGGHHIIDPRSGVSPAAIASATVIAPTAMVADALATAAMVLGPIDGIDLLDRHGADGILLTPSLERFTTRGISAQMHATHA